MPSSYNEVYEAGGGSYSNWAGASSTDASPSFHQIHAKVWENTPGYFTAKRSGVKLQTNGFYGSRVRIRFTRGDWTYYPTANPEQWRHASGTSTDDRSNVGVNAPDEPDLGPVWQGVDSQLLKRIKSSSVNVANAVGEGGKTVKQIADTAKVLAASFMSLRHGNIRDAFRHLGIGDPTLAQGRRFNKKVKKELSLKKEDFSVTGLIDTASTTWLETIYGWEPLLSDVWGLGNGLAHVAERGHSQRVSSSKTVRHRWSRSELNGLGNAISTIRLFEELLSVKKTVEFLIKSDTSKNLAEFGLSNPLSLAWELLPYSFVVDWFLSIGAFIDSIDATLGCTFVNGTESYKTMARHDMFSSGTQNIGPFGDWTYNGTSDGSYEVERWSRVKNTDFPAIPIPQFKNPLSSSHLFTSLALLTQAFLPQGKSFSRG